MARRFVTLDVRVSGYGASPGGGYRPREVRRYRDRHSGRFSSLCVVLFLRHTRLDIKPGAVSIRTKRVGGPEATVSPGRENETSAFCPPGTVITGGGGDFETGLQVFEFRVVPSVIGGPIDHLLLGEFNPTSITRSMSVDAICASMHP